MKNIQPCLWFDQKAEEAALFYTSLFKKNSKIIRTTYYGKAGAQASGQKEGSVMTVQFDLHDLTFLALNGGPHFKFNQSISFFVGCETEEEINGLWKALSKKTHLELKKYPYAEKYGWCEDLYGVNWQLILRPQTQKIMPSLLFVKDRFGKAEEAISYYISLFDRSQIGMISRDPLNQSVLFSTFTLNGQDFVAMESPREHDFDFSEAISFVLCCKTQAEVDHIWEKLSAVPEAERCGWLKDKYGVSWQVVHKDWGEMLSDPDPKKRERMMEAILKMKKPNFKLF